MFAYYGSKSQIVHLYPAPRHSLIIEPFAGSARYALKYFDREVLLIDKYPVVIELWKYLQQSSEKDILSLPETKNGCDLRDFNLTDPERYLIYFCSTGGGAASTGFKVRARSKNCTFNNWSNAKKRIAKQLFKIRHWQIKLGDYTSAPNVEATWFIDPPYTKGGHKYKLGNRINYTDLKIWSEQRIGQVIVCENSNATWMPFINLAKNKGIRNSITSEVFWTNDRVERQQPLF